MLLVYTLLLIRAPRSLKALTLLARSVEDFYARPQDIEWAIDKTGSVFILQSRAITTLGDPKSLSFLPPGDGAYLNSALVSQVVSKDTKRMAI